MKNKSTVNPFDVSRDELLNLAATKLVEQLGDTEQLWSQAESLVRKEVNDRVTKGLNEKIDAVLDVEMKKIMSSVVTPVDIFGERTGESTTIRDTLALRAKKFWEVGVDAQGKESSWGGEPRYKRLMQELLNEAFKQAVKSNAEVVVDEFKKAMLVDAQRIVTENINKLIK